MTAMPQELIGPMTITVQWKPWLGVLAVAFAAASVGACGVKGALEPPPVAKAEGQAKSAESGAAGENTAAKPKPHDDFILDPLLR